MKTLLIDTNSFSKVFNRDNQEHQNYKDVYDAIINKRNVKIVVGGTKFKKELSGTIDHPYDFQKISRNYKQKLLPLKQAQLIIEYKDNKVDKKQLEVIESFCECFNQGKKVGNLTVKSNEIKRNNALINNIKNQKYSKNELKTLLIDELEIKPDFDDPHIIALLNVSKCKNILTDDKRAMPFIKEKCLYDNSNIPKIHTKQSIKSNGLKMK